MLKTLDKFFFMLYNVHVKNKRATREVKMDVTVAKARKEFAEKVKDYLEYKLVDEFGDMAVDVQYLTIDIDEFEDYVDELLREYEK